MNPTLLAAATVAAVLTCALAVAPMWIGGGREAGMAQKGRIFIFAGVLTVVLLAVALASSSNARLTAFIVGGGAFVATIWFGVSQSGSRRALALLAAAATVFALALLAQGR